MNTNTNTNIETINVAATTCTNDPRESFDATLLGRFACVDGKLYGYLDSVHFVPFRANGETVPTYGFVYHMDNGTWGSMLVGIERIRPLFGGMELETARLATSMYVYSERDSLKGRIAMKYDCDDRTRLQAMLNHLDEIEHAI